MQETEEIAIPLAPAEASCIIAHLFVQLELPCPCRPDVVELCGAAYDGSAARITIKGKEVLYYGSIETLERIRAGHCSRSAALRTKETAGNAGGD